MPSFILLVLLTTLFACAEPEAHPPKRPEPALPHSGPSITQPLAPLPTPVLDKGADDVPAIGEAGSFEFGTWNIENFPKSGRSTRLASDVIKKFDVDLMAIEEVASETAFQEVLDAMPGFASVLSPHHYDNNEYQKIAFIYRTADVELLDWELLFSGQDYEFPRPPLQAHFKIKTGSHAGQDIYFIAVHLKATDQDESQERRRMANRLLESHVAEIVARDPAGLVTLLGDFNERVTYPAGLNVFQPWTGKPEAYTFQTEALALAGDYSYISASKPMIDHMISTRNLELKPILIPKLESMIADYRDLVSDHLPVIARLP